MAQNAISQRTLKNDFGQHNRLVYVPNEWSFFAVCVKMILA